MTSANNTQNKQSATQPNQFFRTEMLIGSAGLQRLKDSHVCVFGVGGVGGHAIEALARAGVGTLTIVDKDVVDITNINRQVIATLDTVGLAKVDVMKSRIALINSDCKVFARKVFFLEETAHTFDFSEYDYVIDAVDTVSAKLSIISAARAAGTPVITSMGMACKLDPTQIEVADISKTHTCGLAKVMRRELRRRNISHVKCVFSAEPPVRSFDASASDSSSNGTDAESAAAMDSACDPDSSQKIKKRGKEKPPLASISFVPSVAGMIIASVVTRELISN